MLQASLGCPEILSDDGRLGQLVRAKDWSESPLGPLSSWPRSLHTSAAICLSTRYPAAVLWGRELAHLYNDAFVPILGKKHPAALGAPAREVWADVWDIVQPMLEGVMDGGGATWSENLMLPLKRHGFVEETYFNFSCSPIREEPAGTAGVFAVASETTDAVIGERRLSLLQDLVAHALSAPSEEEACAGAAAALAQGGRDIPFAAFYLLDEEGRSARHVAGTGLAPHSPAIVREVPLEGEGAESTWPLCRARGGHVLVDDLDARFGPIAAGPWPEPVRRAVLFSLTRADGPRPLGYLVLGLSPRLDYDARYAGFAEVVAHHVTAAIETARAHRLEKSRAEAARAQAESRGANFREFFAVVSHELRTPLNAILGWAALLRGAGQDVALLRRGLEAIERNARSQARLISDMLDVARMTTGKLSLDMERVPIEAFVSATVDVIRPAAEAKGVALEMRIPREAGAIRGDSDRLQQVLWNLLTNAVKFTPPEGSVVVEVMRAGSDVLIEVRDTGVGIAPEDLPRLFERFWQADNPFNRRLGGLGLGLAIVQRLVELHGGSVAAASVPGRGTTFSVRLPLAD